MRNYLIAALAATALTTPAVARDKSVYVGVDAGVMLVEDTNLDYNYDGEISYDVDDGITIDHKLGFDVDLVGGYDFGLVRGELELGYKRASIDEVQIDTRLTGLPNPTEPINADGDVNVWSGMVNVLFDFGDEDGWSGFLGAGAGWATVNYDVDVAGFGTVKDKDGSMAWQILAGIRKAITPNIDLGLKYRFFNVSKLDFSEPGIDDGVVALDGRFRSHSLLLSLLYNFYTPPPPPPPPPATQTCPDGTVILATDACPPPPPPPPPPPEPERG